MKSKLVHLSDLSGKMASIYSILTDAKKGTFFDHFIGEHAEKHTPELMNIAGRLRRIGKEDSALACFFKLDEGLDWDDLVCALYDVPDKHLRLYCIRLHETIIIVGNGGHKNVRAWQDDSKLAREVHEMMHYSKIIRTKLNNGSLRISPDGLKLEGELLLINNQ